MKTLDKNEPEVDARGTVAVVARENSPMTAADIRALSGRELDALVAEKVMGWTLRKSTTGNTIASDSEGGVYALDVVVYSGVTRWNPSTDIDAAWTVVERIRQIIPEQTKTQTFSFQLCQTGIPGGWYCSFCVNNSDWSAQAFVEDAASAPRAICEAALLAIKEKS